MHIPDGLLDARVCAGGYVLSALGTTLALRKKDRDAIPRIAAMGAVFFVASLIHFPVGVTSVHLTMIGLTGIVLASGAVPAILTGLFFQVLMFGHGGISTLGVNTVIFGLPSLLIGVAFYQVACRVKSRSALAVIAGVLTAAGISLAALLVLAAFQCSGEPLRAVALLFTISHAVLSGIEGVLTGLIVYQLLRIHPAFIAAREEPPR